MSRLSAYSEPLLAAVAASFIAGPDVLEGVINTMASCSHSYV